jgi:hypothetical protein
MTVNSNHCLIKIYILGLGVATAAIYRMTSATSEGLLHGAAFTDMGRGA